MIRKFVGIAAIAAAITLVADSADAQRRSTLVPA